MTKEEPLTSRFGCLRWWLLLLWSWGEGSSCNRQGLPSSSSSSPSPSVEHSVTKLLCTDLKNTEGIYPWRESAAGTQASARGSLVAKLYLCVHCLDKMKINVSILIAGGCKLFHSYSDPVEWARAFYSYSDHRKAHDKRVIPSYSSTFIWSE